VHKTLGKTTLPSLRLFQWPSPLHGVEKGPRCSKHCPRAKWETRIVKTRRGNVFCNTCQESAVFPEHFQWDLLPSISSDYSKNLSQERSKNLPRMLNCTRVLKCITGHIRDEPTEPAEYEQRQTALGTTKKQSVPESEGQKRQEAIAQRRLYRETVGFPDIEPVKEATG
jgi:hypothetical protein